MSYFREYARGFFTIRCRLEPMLSHFPSAVPEIPVTNVDKAAEYYVNALASDSIGAMTRAASVASRKATAGCS
jgi:hypothetical protein